MLAVGGTKVYKGSVTPQQLFLSADYFLKKKILRREYKFSFLSILQIKKILIVANKTYSKSDRSFNRLRPLCSLTFRARGVKRKVKISRHTLRSLTLTGRIVGLRKLGW